MYCIGSVSHVALHDLEQVKCDSIIEIASLAIAVINFYHNCCPPQSDGELLGDEHTAAIAIRMAQSCNKLMNTFSRKANFNRLSGKHMAHGMVYSYS